MAGQAEPGRVLLPYLQRANELQKHDPLVAYYCRLYAMERGLKIPANERTKATNALLVSLMNQLEKDKKVVKLSPDDNLYVEGFALNVFAKADKQDRSGHADLTTSKTFYAASIFFEVLHQFGEIQPEIIQKQKYAVWKAADIRKALSEGRKPQPGPPDGDQNLSNTEGMIWDMESSSRMGDTRVGPQPFTNDQDNSSTVSDGMGRSEALPLAQSSSDDGLDLPQAPSQLVHPLGHSKSIPAADQSPYTTYPADYGASQYPSSSHIDSSTLPSTAESPYPVYTTSHDVQAPSDSGYYYSDVNITTTSAPLPYPGGYHPTATSYYPASLQSSVHGATSSGSTYTSSGVTYPSSTPYVNPMGQSAGVGYSDPLQHQPMASVPSTQAESSGNGPYPADYQPPPEKIAEAHKASRFAVSALAFDDVPTAIAYLKRSLELLTLPSTTIH